MSMIYQDLPSISTMNIAERSTYYLWLCTRTVRPMRLKDDPNWSNHQRELYVLCTLSIRQDRGFFLTLE